MAKPNGKPQSAALLEPWALPSVGVTLDKPRRVSFPMPAIFRYQDQSGIDVLSPPTKVLNEEEFLEWLLGETPRKRAENLISLLWAGLKVEDSALERDTVANWIGMGNMRQVLAACVGALTMTLPAQENTRPFVAPADEPAEKQLA